jgi:hypothetical protein
MVGDDPERDETDEPTAPASADDGARAAGDDHDAAAVAKGRGDPMGEPPIEEPDDEPPIEEPDDEPPIEEPDDEPPIEEPDEPNTPDEPATEEPDGEPPAPLTSSPATSVTSQDDEASFEAASSDVGEPADEEPFSDDIDLPPPTSVPVPAPYTPPRVVPPALVEEVSPAEGTILGDTRVTLTGQHLYRESIVRIDGQIARTVGATEPREIRVVTPPRKTAGVVDLSVQNPNSEVVTVEKAFRYLPLAPPKISSIAPDHVRAKGGGEITILGEGFVKTTVVLLDGVEAPKVTHVDATTLDVTTPAGKHGKAVDVTVRNPDGKQDVARRAFMYDERFD